MTSISGRIGIRVVFRGLDPVFHGGWMIFFSRSLDSDPTPLLQDPRPYLTAYKLGINFPKHLDPHLHKLVGVLEECSNIFFPLIFFS